jgi:hypothetical protein
MAPEVSPPAVTKPAVTILPAALLQEIEDLCKDCEHRCRFNTHWDNILNVAGILLSVVIIAAGVFKYSEASAILGGLVAAIVTAQRAFPFNQRALFYRNLVGQARNLGLSVRMGLMDCGEAVKEIRALRLDFAQQLPRGTTFRADGSSDSK